MSDSNEEVMLDNTGNAEVIRCTLRRAESKNTSNFVRLDMEFMEEIPGGNDQSDDDLL